MKDGLSPPFQVVCYQKQVIKGVKNDKSMVR